MQNFLGWDPGVFIIETKHVENAVATQAAILVNPDWIENLSDQEKEELRNLLLHHTDDVKAESPKEDTFAKKAKIDPFQQNEEAKTRKRSQ